MTEEWTEWGIYSGCVRKIGRRDFAMEGEGKLVLKYPNKKTVVFVGSFKDDKKHGFGRQTTHVPDLETEVLEFVEGNWHEGHL